VYGPDAFTGSSAVAVAKKNLPEGTRYVRFVATSGTQSDVFLISVMVTGTVVECPSDIPVTGVTLNKPTTALAIGGTETLFATITPSNATNKNITWSSGNASVASVSTTGLITAHTTGTATITATTEDGGHTAQCVVTVSATSIPVTSITINQDQITLTVGQTGQFTANVLPSNATNQNIIWSSAQPDIATVDNNGVVTAIAVGQASIIATSAENSEIFDFRYVTVNSANIPVTSVSLNKNTTTLTVGESETLTATITPSNATNKNLLWSSNNTSVATVSTSGLITAVSTGIADIMVITEDGGHTASCVVTVNAAIVSVTGVTLNKNTTTLTVGETETLTATVLPTNATNKNVTWNSNVPAVVSVLNGTITAHSTGTATITVTTQDGGHTAQCIVTVNAATITVNSVQITDESGTPITTGTIINKETGQTRQLLAKIEPENATNQNVTWSSTNPNIVTVSSTGLVTAIAEGTTTVFVHTECGNRSAHVIKNVSNSSNIVEVENDRTLSVYPNPITDGKLFVEIPENTNAERIEIYDFGGKLVLSQVVNRPKTEINISHLPDGTYVVRIGNVTAKIVKR
jgi:uncharacterized protein YjdB